MFNVCENCKLYRVDKTIDPAGPFAICPECGHGTRFLSQPLMIICGPSGAGKTATCRKLTSAVQEVVILEGDILWTDHFNDPADGYRLHFDILLRVAKNVGQSGRPVALFSSGAIPQNIEPCLEARYFSKIYYLGLVCEDDELTRRLRARPEWRGGGYPDEMLNGQLSFNRWFKAHGAEKGIDLLDTTTDSVEASAEQVKRWILDKAFSDA